MKKINEKLDISLKDTNSFIGRINDLKMNISFENGDLKLKTDLLFCLIRVKLILVCFFR